jgi:hypothetical protein
MTEFKAIDTNENKIFFMEENQKLILEKEIQKSILELNKLFQKEELLKFLYKNIEEGKYDFKEEIENKEEQLTEDEISEKKDKFCRELKEIFDSINPEVFEKYNKRIAKTTINVFKEIYNRRYDLKTNPIRKVKIQTINPRNNENQTKYQKLNDFKTLIQETIYISSFYIDELNKKNSILVKNLDEFYDKKSNVELVTYVNGEEKRAKDDDLIKRVVNTKEMKGTQFILETKKYISEMIQEQMNLNNKLSNLINEFKNLKEQQNTFDKYCQDDNNIFKDINEMDFYE